MTRVLTVAATALKFVNRAALWLAAIGLVAMTAMIAWQVWGRYVMNQSPSWTEALAILIMSWFIFLGAAVGVRENFHLGFDVLLYVLPASAEPVLRAIADIVIFAFGLGMAYYGTQLAVRTWTDHIAGLGIPRGIGYVPLLTGGVLICLYTLERLLRRLAGLPVSDTAAPSGDPADVDVARLEV